MTKNEVARQNRKRELDYAVKRARALAMELTQTNFDDAESIAVLLDHISHLERQLSLVRGAFASWAKDWPVHAIITEGE
jgi:hypothetical protein